MSSDDPLLTILAAHEGLDGALLPIMHAVQAQFGGISRQAEAAIAKALNLARAEVHGVASFYPDFTATADPRPCVQLCQAEACQARGGEALMAVAERAAGERVRIAKVYARACAASAQARSTPNAAWHAGDVLEIHPADAGNRGLKSSNGPR